MPEDESLFQQPKRINEALEFAELLMDATVVLAKPNTRAAAFLVAGQNIILPLPLKLAKPIPDSAATEASVSATLNLLLVALGEIGIATGPRLTNFWEAHPRNINDGFGNMANLNGRAEYQSTDGAGNVTYVVTIADGWWVFTDTSTLYLDGKVGITGRFDAFLGDTFSFTPSELDVPYTIKLGFVGGAYWFSESWTPRDGML